MGGWGGIPPPPIPPPLATYAPRPYLSVHLYGGLSRPLVSRQVGVVRGLDEVVRERVAH